MSREEERGGGCLEGVMTEGKRQSKDGQKKNKKIWISKSREEKATTIRSVVARRLVVRSHYQPSHQSVG